MNPESMVQFLGEHASRNTRRTSTAREARDCKSASEGRLEEVERGRPVLSQIGLLYRQHVSPDLV
jgi:hypothetical protein